MPIRLRMEGETSARIPVIGLLVVTRSCEGLGSFRLGEAAMKGTGLLVWSLVRLPVAGSIMDSQLP